MKHLIKKAIYFMTIMICMMLISFIIVQALIVMDGRHKPIGEVDYVIVLGARLYGDIPSPSLTERLKAATVYLKENEEVKVIVSGGQGIDEDIPEAHAMKKYLLDNHINSDRIIQEDRSTTTFENLSMSLDKVKKTDSRENLRFLIVTNKYHIFRSKFLAKRLGIIPEGLPAKIPPTVVIHSYIREYFAVVKSFFMDRV